ncbi:MAG: hypothetical protein ACFBSF_11940, partial [Leptolyngbyaceae cyanobacterium]
KEITQKIVGGRLGCSASKTQQSGMLAMLGLVPRRQPTVVHSFLEISLLVLDGRSTRTFQNA